MAEEETRVVRSIARAWDRFWFGPTDPLPVALCRISLGVLMFTDFLAATPSWDRFYAPDGMLSLNDPAVTPVVQGWWEIFWWTDGFIPVGWYWWGALVATVGFTVGWWTRFWTIALFVLEASLVHRSPVATNGDDLVFRMLLFYGCFATMNGALALRPCTRTRERWPIRLMQLNIALIYLISSAYKFGSDTAWRDGSALYYAMVNHTWSRWPWPSLFYPAWTSGLATFGSLLLETAFPLLVWFEPFRLPLLLALMLMHVVIAIVLQNVTFFSLSMVCGLCLFLTTDDLHRLRRWWTGRVTAPDAA